MTATLTAPPTKPAPPAPNLDAWLARLPDVPAARIRTDPPIGRATEQDALDSKHRLGAICELYNNTLVEKTMGEYESMVAVAISSALFAWSQQRQAGSVAGADGFIRLRMGNLRAPDVAFFAHDALPDPQVLREDNVPRVPPLLCVEVLSESNTAGEIAQKIREYFAHGVRLVWIFDPADDSARVHDDPADPQASRRLGRGEAVDGGDLLPGFSLDVAAAFDLGGRP